MLPALDEKLQTRGIPLPISREFRAPQSDVYAAQQASQDASQHWTICQQDPLPSSQQAATYLRR
jgi:hypothetical protein